MKIFATGMQRTGLMSLTAALNRIGVRAYQFPKELYDDVGHELISKFDAFVDFPVPLLYRKLDESYPGSKFIHTIRDETAWLRSVEWLFTTGAIKFAWANHHYADLFHGDFYGVTEFDEAVFIERYRRYNEEVMTYFSDRPEDFMVIDLTAGQGYERVCPFLGLAIPEFPFPHTNQSEGLYRSLARKLKDRLVRGKRRGRITSG